MWTFEVPKLSYEELFSYLLAAFIAGIVLMAWVMSKIDKVPIKPVKSFKDLFKLDKSE